MRVCPRRLCLGLSVALLLGTRCPVSRAEPSPEGASLPPVPGLGVQDRTLEGASWSTARARMIAILLDHEYGHSPPLPSFRVRDLATTEIQLEGLPRPARQTVANLVFGPDDRLVMKVGCWIPDASFQPCPAVLAIEPVWWPDPFQRRGVVQRALARGYAFAGFDHNALASYEDPKVRAARDAYPEADWGVVAVAAWGSRLTLNWLETLPEIQASQVAVWGHSRRGKSALLAGALDPRFGAVLPHMSGMAGAALYRRRGPGAQRIDQLLERFWLHPRLFTYMDHEDEMPFDQHWLLALIAPRPFYLHVGRGDAWGNPTGEYAAWQASRDVYQRFGHPERAGFHLVAANHVDPNGPEGAPSWETVLDFLDWQFRGKPPTRNFAAPTFNTAE